MAMCPNCGQIIMNGDPYCSHCGTALSWSADDSSSRGGLFSEDVILRDIPITSFDMALERLNVSANTVRAIKRDVDITRAGDCRINIVHTYHEYGIKITFIRQNRYFKTTDSIKFDPASNRIMGHYFYSDFTGLRHADWFMSAVRKKEAESGLEFYDCGGGYDSRYDWQNGRFELKSGCEVIAHFIEDESYYRGYKVNFNRHGLEYGYERYERGNVQQALRDYDFF